MCKLFFLTWDMIVTSETLFSAQTQDQPFKIHLNIVASEYSVILQLQ